jgi:hypothetical protein
LVQVFHLHSNQQRLTAQTELVPEPRLVNKATEPYTEEAWAPWCEAATKFQAAVTAHAEATGVSRVELEMAVKKAVLHPEPEGDS